MAGIFTVFSFSGSNKTMIAQWADAYKGELESQRHYSDKQKMLKITKDCQRLT